MPRPFTGVDGHPLRWLLYKDPRVELRDSSGRDLDDESTGDAEYSAWLLREAEEELEISTDIRQRRWRHAVCPRRPAAPQR